MAAAFRPALRWMLPCSRATTSASSLHSTGTRRRSHSGFEQAHAALLVANVARQHVGRRGALAQVVGQAGKAHGQAGVADGPPGPAPASRARRCRPRGGARRFAARPTGGPVRAAGAPARRSRAARRTCARAGLPSARATSSCHTRSATRWSTSPCATISRISAMRLGRDVKVGKAGGKARQTQDAHRVFAKRRASRGAAPCRQCPGARHRGPPARRRLPGAARDDLRVKLAC